jgi:O-antigen/teichoic acid export membrane protein
LRKISLSRKTIHLLAAMGARICASAMYVLAVFLVNRNATAEDASALIYVISVCFVSFALGTVGLDHQIPAHAIYFQRKASPKAVSIFYTFILAQTILVPAVAMLIHGVFSSFNTTGLPQVSLLYMGTTALAFSLAQTIAVVMQARGHSLLPIVVFPFTSYAIIAASAVLRPDLTVSVMIWSFVIPAIIGMLYGLWVMPPRRLRLRWRWLTSSLYFYMLDISHFVGAWAPFTYLHLILTPSEVVILNLATRLASLQSMPSNAVGAYLAPQFSINFKTNTTSETEVTMMRVLTISLLFQLFYSAALIVLLFVTPTIAGIDTSKLVLILLVLSIGQFVNGMTGPVGPALLMSGSRMLMVFTSWTILFLATLFGVLLAMVGGVLAFSISISVASLAQNLIYAFYLNQRTGINVLRMPLSLLRKSLFSTSRSGS